MTIPYPIHRFVNWLLRLMGKDRSVLPATLEDAFEARRRGLRLDVGTFHGTFHGQREYLGVYPNLPGGGEVSNVQFYINRIPSTRLWRAKDHLL